MIVEVPETEFVTFSRVRNFLRVDYNVIISERRDCYGNIISVIVKKEEHFQYWLGAPFYDNEECEGEIVE